MSDRPTNSRFRLRLGERTFALPPGISTAGRGEGCEIPIDDRMVSRKHARFTVGEGGVAVEDLGSVNGITVNGAPARGPKTIFHGDRVGIGSAVLVVVDTHRSVQGTPTRPKPTLEMEDATSADVDALERALGRRDRGAAEAAATAAVAKATRRLPQRQLISRLETALVALAETEPFWLERALELRAADGSVPSPELVARLHTLARTGRPVADGALRAYLTAMQAKSTGLVTADRFVYRRLESLLRLKSDG